MFLSFFVGLGSRCIWSGAIIAGQFFPCDVLRRARPAQQPSGIDHLQHCVWSADCAAPGAG